MLCFCFGCSRDIIWKRLGAIKGLVSAEWDSDGYCSRWLVDYGGVNYGFRCRRKVDVNTRGGNWIVVQINPWWIGAGIRIGAGNFFVDFSNDVVEARAGF